jgi:hypothetical protein
MDIEIKPFPELKMSETFIFHFIESIWPHRIDVILKELANYQYTGEGDVFFWILVNGQIAGLTGHYDYDKDCVGLGLHGLLPEYRNFLVSKISIDLVKKEAKKVYPKRAYFIEIIPNHNEKLIQHFSQLGFSLFERKVENFSWLPQAQNWNAYYVLL